MTDDPDLVGVLTQQHRDVELMFEELADIRGEVSEEALVLARQVVIALTRHSVAEELHLYPTVRERLEHGDALADRELAEHAEAERAMSHVESLRPTNEAFWPALQDLQELVREHVQEEENEVFPRLREACGDGELRALAVKLQRTQRWAPTRPHPGGPAKGVPLAVVGPVYGLLDRMRDAASGRGRPLRVT